MAMPKSKFMKRSQEHDSTCCRPPTDSASVLEESSKDAYAQRSISCLSYSMTLARTTPNEACAMCRSRGIGQAMCTLTFCKDVPVGDSPERKIDLCIKHRLKRRSRILLPAGRQNV
jgi:hypothetical protein